MLRALPGRRLAGLVDRVHRAASGPDPDFMNTIDCRGKGDWIDSVVQSLACVGCCIVTNLLDPPLIEQLRSAMYRARAAIVHEVGEERLRAAHELGVLRLMMKFDPVFFRLLELPEVLQIVDRTLSPTAILHLQNGFILPSFARADTPEVFQNRMHRDFPRVLNGYLASVNIFFAIDAFTEDNGATLMVPGSHQRADAPSALYMENSAVPATCAAGAALVFDSTLWHAAGLNRSGSDRLAINQQFTRSYIKQQIDYVRALGESTVRAQSDRTQQLLGYYTRVVTSLDEYYRPEHERLYRRGQG
jgi:ectoine hydroxylase-related dioxygenase (phytanoyl-CoA dioxygenase family)